MATTPSGPTQAYPSASPPRRNQLNRSIPGSLLGWRWGWLRGTLPESPVDQGTSKLLKFCLVSSHVTWFRLVSSHVISQNLPTSRFQKNCLVSSHVTLPLEPGAAPGPWNTLRQAQGWPGAPGAGPGPAGRRPLPRAQGRVEILPTKARRPQPLLRPLSIATRPSLTPNIPSIDLYSSANELALTLTIAVLTLHLKGILLVNIREQEYNK